MLAPGKWTQFINSVIINGNNSHLLRPVKFSFILAFISEQMVCLLYPSKAQGNKFRQNLYTANCKLKNSQNCLNSPRNCNITREEIWSKYNRFHLIPNRRSITFRSTTVLFSCQNKLSKSCSTLGREMRVHLNCLWQN